MLPILKNDLNFKRYFFSLMPSVWIQPPWYLHRVILPCPLRTRWILKLCVELPTWVTLMSLSQDFGDNSMHGFCCELLIYMVYKFKAWLLIYYFMKDIATLNIFSKYFQSSLWISFLMWKALYLLKSYELSLG